MQPVTILGSKEWDWGHETAISDVLKVQRKNSTRAVKVAPLGPWLAMELG